MTAVTYGNGNTDGEPVADRLANLTTSSVDIPEANGGTGGAKRMNHRPAVWARIF